MKKKKSTLPPIDPDVYEKITDKVAEAVTVLNIQGLIGKIIVDTTGKVPTACWNFNPDTKQYAIKLGYELLLKLETEEIFGIIEHELLHHVYYQKCDIRNAIMSNIVLDVAINKILYLCNPGVTESWARKVYTNVDKLVNSPIVLACPFLSYEQIQSIPNEMIRAAYIDIWGSRETALDFNCDVPVPLTLYYKIIKFVPSDKEAYSPFGEDSDEESDDDSKESDEKSDDNKKKSNKKGKRKRCDDKKTDDSEKESGDGSDNDSEEESDEDADKKGGGEDGEDKEENKEDGKGEAGKNKDDDEDGEESESGNSDESKNDTSDSGESNGSSDQDDNGYSDCDDPTTDELKDFTKKKEKEAKQAGQGKSKISFVRPPSIDFNCTEIDAGLRAHMLEETINEVSESIIGSLADDIIRLPYITRPTRTTLTYMACGVTDYLPVYYNHKGGEAKPKVACYVDISGSMRDSMQLVHNIMNKIGEFLPSASFVFHDSVMPMPTAAWNNTVPLGGGTNFNNIFSHICMSPEEKREWFENWTGTDLDYYSRRHPVNSVLAEWMQEYGVQGDLLSEDFPVIVIITDGDATIRQERKQFFLQQQKKLVVLLLTSSVQKKHAFSDIAETVIQIDPSGEIIDKVTQTIDRITNF